MNSFEFLLTHSQKGLNVDTLNEASKYFEADLYAATESIVVFFSKRVNRISVYNLDQAKITSETDSCNIKRLIVSSDSFFFATLDYNKQVLLYSADCKFLLRLDDVDDFAISAFYLATLSGGELNLLNLSTLSHDFQLTNIKFFVLLGSFLICATKKMDKANKLIFYHKAQKILERSFEEIHKIEAVSDTAQDFFLAHVTTEQVRNSYYGVTELFLLDRHRKIISQVRVQDPVLDFGFIRNTFYVCHGPQPSFVTLYSPTNLSVLKKFPAGIRNKVYFSPHTSLVCFAGFNNLNGGIEVYNQSLTAKVHELGASNVIWANNGAYFCVCVTNEMKIDNRIVIYDYYGRLINSTSFDKLLAVQLLRNKPAPFITLQKPESSTIKDDSVYVPPHLRSNHKETSSIKETRNSDRPWLETRVSSSKDLSPSRQKKFAVINRKDVKSFNPKQNLVRGKLQNVTATENQIDLKTEIKEKLKEIELKRLEIKNGLNPTIDDMNLILSENQLLEDMARLENKK